MKNLKYTFLNVKWQCDKYTHFQSSVRISWNYGGSKNIYVFMRGKKPCDEYANQGICKAVEGFCVLLQLCIQTYAHRICKAIERFRVLLQLYIRVSEHLSTVKNYSEHRINCNVNLQDWWQQVQSHPWSGDGGCWWRRPEISIGSVWSLWTFLLIYLRT